MGSKNTGKSESGASVSQYLTFQLASETYGVPLHQVQEIRTYTPTTRMPNAPDYVLGVVNLRGSIIAMVDLRTRLNMPAMGEDEQTIVVVANIRNQTCGLRADAVSDVVSIPADQIQDAPKVTAADQQAFIAGLAQVQDRVFILLDLERVIDTDEVMSLAA
jgi:purine-binding chemotaxis protein CheW